MSITTIPIGKAKVVSEGEDLTVVTWGATMFQALEAIDSLPEDVSVELIDLRSIYPFDMDTIAESVSKTGRCVVAHEAPADLWHGRRNRRPRDGRMLPES